ncbi:uncharacterized protein METZ01_LOCUS179958 [marine metagenome]|uniref:Uncharacterized protein n=1 Tax=marine metagenome TaxID=408172 RepID=A0A382CMN6_9ZZZZ
MDCASRFRFEIILYGDHEAGRCVVYHVINGLEKSLHQHW